jgi:hypothetical protein
MDFPFYHCQNGAEHVIFCEAATKGSVLNSTTPIFMGGGSCKKVYSNIFEELSRLGAIY